jgi:hypothetical protein
MTRNRRAMLGYFLRTSGMARARLWGPLTSIFPLQWRWLLLNLGIASVCLKRGRSDVVTWRAKTRVPWQVLHGIGARVPLYSEAFGSMS